MAMVTNFFEEKDDEYDSYGRVKGREYDRPHTVALPGKGNHHADHRYLQGNQEQVHGFAAHGNETIEKCECQHVEYPAREHQVGMTMQYESEVYSWCRLQKLPSQE